MYNLFIHPQAGLQNILTPSPVDQPATAGLKMINPLQKDMIRLLKCNSRLVQNQRNLNSETSVKLMESKNQQLTRSKPNKIKITRFTHQKHIYL